MTDAQQLANTIDAAFDDRDALSPDSAPTEVRCPSEN